jgi:hypothetical protein
MLDREAVKRQIYNQNPQHWNAMGRRGMTELDKAADLQISQMRAQQKAAAKAPQATQLNPDRIKEFQDYYAAHLDTPPALKGRSTPEKEAYRHAMFMGAPGAAQREVNQLPPLDSIQEQRERRWISANRPRYQGFGTSAAHLSQAEEAYNQLKESGQIGQFPAWNEFKATLTKTLGGVSDTELDAIGHWLGPEFVKGITGRAGIGIERQEWVKYLSGLRSPQQFEALIKAMRGGIKGQMDELTADYNGDIKPKGGLAEAQKRVMNFISKPGQQIMQPSMPPPSVPTRERYEIVQ